MDQVLRINKYLPLAILYFFFNSLMLPLGLLYTTILTPFFVLWLYRFPSFKIVWVFLFMLTPFVIIHLIDGVYINYYLRSLLLFLSVFIFGLSFYQFLQNCKSLRTIYKNILLLNTFFLCIALLTLFIHPLKALFWTEASLSPGLDHITRLKLLTYEPSYYSTLLVPIALYYYLKIAMKELPAPFTIFLLLTVPVILSLSFGVILGLVFALFITFSTNITYFFPKKKLAGYLVFSSLSIFLALIVLFIFFPKNIVFTRIANIFAGRDTSFKGRTIDSFYLGWNIAGLKNIYFGCGLGQVKELGLDLFRKLYKSSDFTVNDVVIPNAVGETLAIFGIAGIFLRFGIEFYFFFKTAVYTNYYRLSLFLFIFIYQFTGSYIMNIAEYVIWILAFTDNHFEEFKRRDVYQRSKKSNAVTL
jgi:hypothetical protein